MNAPKRPPRKESRPSPQAGQARGSLPSPLSGKSMGARNSSSACVTSDGFCSITSAVLGLKSRQKASSTFRSEEHTSELQSLMRISYAVFCLKKKTHNIHHLNST